MVEDGLEEVVEDGLEEGAGAGFGFSPAHAAASPRARPAKITVAAKLLAASMILSVRYWCVGHCWRLYHRRRSGWWGFANAVCRRVALSDNVSKTFAVQPRRPQRRGPGDCSTPQSSPPRPGAARLCCRQWGSPRSWPSVSRSRRVCFAAELPEVGCGAKRPQRVRICGSLDYLEIMC